MRPADSRKPRSLAIVLPLAVAAVVVATAPVLGYLKLGTQVGSRTLNIKWNAAIRAGGWQTTLGVGLREKMLGVMGLGNQGSWVAEVGKAFGMEVIAWSQNLTAERASERGATLVTKEELLRRSDVLTIQLVLSDRTRGIVGAGTG